MLWRRVLVCTSCTTGYATRLQARPRNLGPHLTSTGLWRCTRTDNLNVSRKSSSWAPTNQRRLTASVLKTDFTVPLIPVYRRSNFGAADLCAGPAFMEFWLHDPILASPSHDSHRNEVLLLLVVVVAVLVWRSTNAVTRRRVRVVRRLNDVRDFNWANAERLYSWFM